jgi:hypothetical protein
MRWGKSCLMEKLENFCPAGYPKKVLVHTK